MRRIAALIMVLVIAAMAWAAAHDIIKEEVDTSLEIAFLAVSPLLAGLALWWGFKTQKRNTPEKSQN